MVKKGRRKYGAIYTRFKDGRELKFYLAFRRARDIFCDGEPTNSDAIRKGKAIWAIDYDTLLRLQRDGIHAIGVFEYESGELYWTTLKTFLNRNVAKPRDYTARGGENQRYLPFHQFKVKRTFKGGRW